MERESSAAAEDAIDLTGLGLRPIVRWVPDTRDPDFMRRYREQRAVIAASASNAEEIEWWERVQTHDGWGMRRGDIVTVAPPGEYGKPRPALIIQCDEALPSMTLTYVPITSDLLRVPDVRIPVQPTPANGLNKPSELTVDMIQTTSAGRFGGVIGRLEPVSLRLVEASLSVHLGLLDQSHHSDKIL